MQLAFLPSPSTLRLQRIMAHTRLIAFVLLSIAGVFLLLRKPTPALEKSISLPPSTQRNQAHFSLAREPGRPFSSRTVVVGDIHGDLPVSLAKSNLHAR